MKLSAVLGPLLDGKADHEMIRQIVLAYEAQVESALEKRRESDRKRQQEFRERNVTSRDPSVTGRDGSLVRGGDTRGENNKLLLEEAKEEKKDRSPSAPSPRQALREVLDDERAAAVVEHRQRIKKPLTGHAAKILAGKLAKFPDPNSAADEMIANGWQRIEVGWLDQRQGNLRVVAGQQGPPQPNRDPQTEMLDAIQRRVQGAAR